MEPMVDETAKQSEKDGEEEEAPKKRKQEPLMANTKQEVAKVFQERKMTLGKKLNNEKAVNLLLDQFYNPFEVVLRLNLYKDRINTSKRRAAGVPLHAFYMNVPQNERMAYLFDIHEPDTRKLKNDTLKDQEENWSEAKKAITAFVKIKE